MKLRGSLLYAVLCAIAVATPSKCGILVEGFDNITLLAGRGWVMTNNSDPAGGTNWFQGTSGEFPAQAGATEAYIAANYNNVPDNGTISNWLITPEFLFENGDSLNFFTRTVDAPVFPDRVEVRFSSNGASTDVGSSSGSIGDFTTLLFVVNSGLTTSGYPNSWTQYVVQMSGLSGSAAGRLAFRYYVPDSGPDGNNGDYIGIDSVTIDAAPIPEPTTSMLVAIGFAAGVALARMRRCSR
jgi:hypothetical protein